MTNRDTPSAKTVAQFLLYLAGRDEISDMDQFKVQKALYFCQGWSLALRGKVLFEDEIQAWPNGPVVPSVWREYTDWEDRYIDPESDPPDTISAEDQSFIEAIWCDLRDLSGKKLRNLTHESPPWIDARGDYSPDQHGRKVIPKKAMRDHFRGKAQSWRRK